MYSGHYSRIFLAPKNAQNAETKRRLGAVPILLLAISASTTGAYSSLNVSQELNPQPWLLKALVYHSATSVDDLGVKLDFQEKTIIIDKILLPMRNIANLQLKPRITRALRENTCFAQKPISTRSATKPMVKILDAKYEKADLHAIIRENCSHLTASNREKLLSVLLKFKSLFDGTLGDWKLLPASFELKEGMKPYHGRPYLIPHKHKAVLMKEIKRLCNIGVLEWQPLLRWALPTFIIPKKDSTVRTISDFWELNKRIVRKPYSIPKNQYNTSGARRLHLCHSP